MAKASMEKYVNDYKKKYLPGHDKLKCLDVIELLNMAQAQTDAEGDPENLKFNLIGYAFQAGFMRGYGCAKYDIEKKKKG